MSRISIPIILLAILLSGCATTSPGIATSEMWTKGSFVTEAPRGKIRAAVLESPVGDQIAGRLGAETRLPGQEQGRGHC